MSGREVSYPDCRRFVRAFATGPASERVDHLGELVALEVEVRYQTKQAVARLRQAGITDQEIANELGVTRQAVQKRWPERGRPTGAGARYRSRQ